MISDRMTDYIATFVGSAIASLVVIKSRNNEIITQMDALRWAGAKNVQMVKRKGLICNYSYVYDAPIGNKLDSYKMGTILKDYKNYQKIMKKSEKMTKRVNKEGLNVRNVFTEKDYKIIKDICKKYDKDIDADMII